MKITTLIEADLWSISGPLPGGEDFARQFASHKTGPTTVYSFDDEVGAARALAALKERGLVGRRFYVIHLTPEELSTYPAVYFGLENIVELIAKGRVKDKKMGALGIAKDYPSGQIVLSAAARSLLEGVTREVEWIPLKGARGEWHGIASVPVLPEPIFIPAPIEQGEDEEPYGSSWVRSDGRDVIPEADVAVLDRVGIAASHSMKIGEQTYQWQPRFIASGSVVSAILKAGVRGLLEPLTPLLIQGHPLAR